LRRHDERNKKTAVSQTGNGRFILFEPIQQLPVTIAITAVATTVAAAAAITTAATTATTATTIAAAAATVKTTTAAASASATTIFTRLRFIHAQAAALEILAIQCTYRTGGGAFIHFNETESTKTTGIPICNPGQRLNCSML
jgi:hypothetical protein